MKSLRYVVYIGKVIKTDRIPSLDISHWSFVIFLGTPVSVFP
jgi:hypothetical protein